MTGAAVTFPYIQLPDPPPTLRPMLPIVLERGTATVNELGLVDSGADTSIMPFDVGLRLGIDWNSQVVIPTLGGILAGYAARGVVLLATVAPFPLVRLAFAWVQKNDVPVILGQVNFFMEFDVAFYRHKATFEIEPHAP